MVDDHRNPPTYPGPPADPELAAMIQFEVPHSARIWNYWMGGKDNYPVDREAGDAWIAIDPGVVPMAQQSRQFLIRVVRYLAGEAGIGQFLDIGTGLPTMHNTHEIAQHIAPHSRVVYVDNDHCKSGCGHADDTATRQVEQCPVTERSAGDLPHHRLVRLRQLGGRWTLRAVHLRGPQSPPQARGGPAF